MHYLTFFPSILDPQWRDLIYSYPHTLLLLNSSFQFFHTGSPLCLDLPNEKQDILTQLVNEFGNLISHKIPSTDLINVKAPFLF